ncbi:N-acetylmuramoyl-L-alanine amidase [Paraflavitalea sp. CAU 1676]|uniref:N-acetylmuramoyl-L-alanine amidase n=1 Tax=Paraflavitalea sp. CAU 1676 TaxID=3032598 RepID=UPI0023DC4A48|nr:N-acetylmuramoyl-L-alanine amidase [Paraflavitalea sp. CAU 1676]MDF2190885.1 N-acetylmuramoyl-L-alanine amidase [Paraflavitalea sp. CAU 1676]
MKQFATLSFLFLLFSTSRAQDTTRYFFVRTTGQLPFLEYGLGDDRLGGAKMTYLDTNVVLKVIDSAGTDYKVQLSKYHIAYVAKSNVKTDTATKDKPYYLTGSWRAYGNDTHDYVTIAMEERLPYRAIQQINPSRLAVDIFGATSNSNWITQLKTLKEIKNAWYEQTEDDVLRVFIELKHHQHWGHFISYDSAGKKLVIRIKRQPGKLNIRNLTIAVDAGHGGSNTGASGKMNKGLEKAYTLQFAEALQHYLGRKGVKVYMTRTADVDISMPDRTLALRQQDPSLLISLHLNSSGNPASKGTSTYYRYIGFRPLTTAILDRMLQLGLDNYGNIGNFNFALSGPTEYPNCLVEIAFLSNEEEEKKIMDPAFHKAVAKKIYKGIRDWLKANRR